jgi:hypothetical protein
MHFVAPASGFAFNQGLSAVVWRGLNVALTALFTLLLAACGGGNSTESSIIGTVEVSLEQPSGANTVDVVVDEGPAGSFSLAAANLPYVTVTLCEPGSSTRCTTIDHVFLDTGSIGLRVLKSAVAGLALPRAQQAGAALAECYPFVVGAVWGPVARADLQMNGERAASLPIQLIDDGQPMENAAPADCQRAAEGSLMQSLGALQAKGILGIGLLQHDCGQLCQSGAYDPMASLAYYACAPGAACVPTAAALASQVQQPITYFVSNNNGSIVMLPALPEAGALKARGRLIFGIGTQANNQLGINTQVLAVDADPSSPSYLYLSTELGGRRFASSYIDSGSNGLFFDDASITSCAGGGGAAAWYCPGSVQRRTAQVSGISAAGVGRAGTAAVNFSIANANALFSTTNTAFASLGGSAGSSNPGAFVWGLPFFYGRAVYTSIWGQALSTNGPWYGF